MRSGTVVVGLGSACELANGEKEYDHQHVKRISDMLAQVKMIGVDVMMVMTDGDDYDDVDHQDCGDLQLENCNHCLT